MPSDTRELATLSNRSDLEQRLKGITESPERKRKLLADQKELEQPKAHEIEKVVTELQAVRRKTDKLESEMDSLLTDHDKVMQLCRTKAPTSPGALGPNAAPKPAEDICATLRTALTAGDVPTDLAEGLEQALSIVSAALSSIETQH